MSLLKIVLYLRLLIQQLCNHCIWITSLYNVQGFIQKHHTLSIAILCNVEDQRNYLYRPYQLRLRSRFPKI